MSDSQEFQDLSKLTSNIFDKEVRDKIDSSYRCQRQLERCNILATQAGDPVKNIEFENSVEALMGDLPTKIRLAVLDRREDYIVKPEPRWQYLKAGRYNMGTPDNPVKDDYGNVISPIKVQDPPFEDPMTKLSIIKEELESGGASWRYDKTLRDEGRTPRLIPFEAEQELENVIRDTVVKHRKAGVMYSWADLLLSLQKAKFAIPTPAVTPKSRGDR